LSETDSVVTADLQVVMPNEWPDAVSPEYGECELKRLCDRFLLPYTSCLKCEYRNYKESFGSVVGPTSPLPHCQSVRQFVKGGSAK